MDEAGARALMERLSVTEPPLSRVDIRLARQRGAQRLRRRRWGLAGAPLAAAAAVVAVILGAEAITGPGGAGPGKQPGPPVVSAHFQFNPLAPYAAFGWLPKGDLLGLNSQSSLPSQLQLTAGTPVKGKFMLTVWAPGACNLGPAQAQVQVRERHHPTLGCQLNAAGSGWAVQLIRPGPAVAGRPSFWFDGTDLAWAYSPHAWATMSTYRRGTPVSVTTLVKVAAHVRYAATARPSVKFPFRFTGLPASWRVLSDIWRATPAGLLASADRALVRGTDVGSPNPSDAGVISQIVILPGRDNCQVYRDSQHWRRAVLNGVPAIVAHFSPSGSRPFQGLCVPETNGMHVSFFEFSEPGQAGFPFGGVTGLFTHHLRLLGADPANWTTQPLG